MINENFINESLSISHSMQVSKVASSIRQMSHNYGYVSKYWTCDRVYLQMSSLISTLENMKYHKTVATELATWIRTNIQNAYEKGVFVVTDSVLKKGNSFSADTPDILLSALRDAEPEYFTSTKWYNDDYTQCLRYEHWHHDIYNCIGKLTLRYARAAFTQGMKDACNQLVS